MTKWFPNYTYVKHIRTFFCNGLAPSSMSLKTLKIILSHHNVKINHEAISLL